MADPARSPAPVPQAVVEPAVSILCDLGRLQSSSEVVVIDAKDAKRNSNRWTFDVAHDPRRSKTFELELLEYGTGKPVIASFYPKIIPLDEAAARAAIWTPDPDRPSFEIASDHKGVLRYRVIIESNIYTTTPRRR